MAWIETIREDQRGGDLTDLYPQVVDVETGRVDNIMQIHSLNPKALAAQNAQYECAMRGTPALRTVERCTDCARGEHHQ